MEPYPAISIRNHPLNFLAHFFFFDGRCSLRCDPTLSLMAGDLLFDGPGVLLVVTPQYP